MKEEKEKIIVGEIRDESAFDLLQALEIPSEAIKKTVEKEKGEVEMSGFVQGQEVTLFVKGAGTISKEQHVIEEIENGVITLEEIEKRFDENGKWLETDPIFNFNFWIE